MKIYDELYLKPSSKGNYIVMKDYDLGYAYVPKGYETNGGDVPRIFTSFISRYSPKLIPLYTVHDYYCSLGWKYNKQKSPIKLVFKIFDNADRLLLKVGQEAGVNKFQLYAIYFGVRVYNILIRRLSILYDRFKNK